MHPWQSEKKRGILFLKKHDPCQALKCLTHALELCPVSETKDLSRLLFYIGMILKRFGLADCAIKSWLDSQRLVKGGYSSRILRRLLNSYGMESQGSEKLDDWRAFYSIQLARYINSKRKKRFCCDAERDMIRDLILDHWKDLLARGVLENKSPQEKNRIFKAVKIVFPFIMPGGYSENPLIYVNFKEKKPVGGGERCPCGSGLTFMACCGRIPGETELLNGNL